MEQTYRAAPSSYIVLIGLVSIPAFLWLLVVLQNQSTEYIGLLVSLCPPLFLSVWLASFRLDFSETGITYRSLFGGTRTAAYSDIKAIGTSRVAPVSRSPLGITIQLHIGKDIVVNTKPFPIEAAMRLFGDFGVQQAAQERRAQKCARVLAAALALCKSSCGYSSSRRESA